MKSYLIIVLISFLNVSLPGHNTETMTADSPVVGFLDITVESNVNKVLFSYPISSRNLNPGNNKSTKIIVPVKEFRCDNKIAYRDFLTLLKADLHPELTIALPGDVLQQLKHEEEVILKDVTINIAGISREYDIMCRAEENPVSGDKILSGTIMIDLKDLDINPPVKYFGMVKIKDEVIVKFGLGIKEQNFARK